MPGINKRRMVDCKPTGVYMLSEGAVGRTRIMSQRLRMGGVPRFWWSESHVRSPGGWGPGRVVAWKRGAYKRYFDEGWNDAMMEEEEQDGTGWVVG
jgi:hypothetical protein